MESALDRTIEGETIVCHRGTLDPLAYWQKNGWMTASKKPVGNQDLWEQLLEQSAKHEVKWVKVKGHADDEINNRVDRLAVDAMWTATENSPK